jgi:hypothetical protein
MTIYRDLKRLRQLAAERLQPRFQFLNYSLRELQREIHSVLFPDVTQSVTTHFTTAGPLACVYCTGTRAEIYLHQLFNHADTPREVLAFVLKHELLHLRIPPAHLARKHVQHPPEFWQAERLLCPDRDQAWAWISINYGACLKVRRKLERIDVLQNWKDIWSRPCLEWTACAAPAGGKSIGTLAAASFT